VGCSSGGAGLGSELSNSEQSLDVGQDEAVWSMARLLPARCANKPTRFLQKWCPHYRAVSCCQPLPSNAVNNAISPDHYVECVISC
jgi:hypothetical protein